MRPLTLFLLACGAIYLGTIQAAFNALMRVSLRLLAEAAARARFSNVTCRTLRVTPDQGCWGSLRASRTVLAQIIGWPLGRRLISRCMIRSRVLRVLASVL